jgi:hypothetical protein
MAGTASGVTSFVLGREADGNREMRTFIDGETYDLDADLITAYSADSSEFPII